MEKVGGEGAVSLTEDEWALLDQNADDWYGLWEVDWWFNGVYPDWPFDRRAEFVSSLVRRGLMEVFYGRLGLERPPLETKAADAALAVPVNWKARSDIEEPVYHISTSEAGRAALKTIGEQAT
jgi:hypothetical protein